MASAVSNSWNPRVLVMGPGGIKGLKILGFLSPIEDSGLLEKVDTYCGVSVGAILSLLLITGYTVREIIGEAIMLDLFKDLISFNIKTSVSQRGLLSSEPIRKRLTDLLLGKFGMIPTLEGLYLRTGKAFVAVTLNATDEECVMMGPFTHQHVSCIDATMFSMNIPFVFYQLIYNEKTYVDGALANPYPIDYFDDGNTDILGIYLCSSKAVTRAIAPARIDPLHPNTPIIQRIEAEDTSTNTLSISSYWVKMVNSLLEQRRVHIMQHASSRCKNVSLETNTNDLIGVSLTIEDKVKMMTEGYNEGKAFLKQLRDGIYRGPRISEPQKYTYPQYYMNV